MTDRKVGFLTHEYYFWHDTKTHAGSYQPGEFIQPGKHWESSESKRRFKSLVDVSNIKKELIELDPRQATFTELNKVHTKEHIELMKQRSDAGGGLMGFEEDSLFGKFGFEICSLAAGGAIVASEKVFKKEVDVAYALIRPPGHHAVKEQGMGYCMFNNIAVAIEYLKETTNLKRFAVIDWDVHHGNGTESLYYSDSNVLTISLHQDELYPRHTGKVTDIGEKEGKGFNINIPLPAGSGDGAYKYAFENVVIPAVKRFKPEFIFVASGFDASYYDPLSRMALHSFTYKWMANEALKLADEFCEGRLVATHEGGYSEVYVPFCGLSVLESFLGKDSNVGDPLMIANEAMTRKDQKLHPHQKEMIDECKKIHNL